MTPSEPRIRAAFRPIASTSAPPSSAAGMLMKFCSEVKIDWSCSDMRISQLRHSGHGGEPGSPASSAEPLPLPPSAAATVGRQHGRAEAAVVAAVRHHDEDGEEERPPCAERSDPLQAQCLRGDALCARASEARAGGAGFGVERRPRAAQRAAVVVTHGTLLFLTFEHFTTKRAVLYLNDTLQPERSAVHRASEFSSAERQRGGPRGVLALCAGRAGSLRHVQRAGCPHGTYANWLRSSCWWGTRADHVAAGGCLLSPSERDRAACGVTAAGLPPLGPPGHLRAPPLPARRLDPARLRLCESG